MRTVIYDTEAERALAIAGAEAAGETMLHDDHFAMFKRLTFDVIVDKPLSPSAIERSERRESLVSYLGGPQTPATVAEAVSDLIRYIGLEA